MLKNILNRVHRFLTSGAIFICVFTLISCVDYVEVFSVKNGNLYCYCKTSIVKMDGDNSITDIENYKKQLPSNATFNEFADDYYMGYEVRFNSNLKMDSEMQKYMPTKNGNLFYIPIFLAKDIAKQLDLSDSKGDDYGMGSATSGAMLVSCKCHIQVSKDILKTVKSAYFLSTDAKNIAVSFYDYGDEWTFEMPFEVFTKSNLDTTKIIVTQ